MELRHLRYFVAVAEEKSFSRAALRLNMAQPPLGRQIRDLEAQIGAELLRRGGAVLELTPAGDAFLREARLALAQGDRAIEAARLVANGRSGVLRVGYISSAFLLSCMINHFRQFRAAFPSVKVTLSQMTPPTQLEALAEDRIDLGIMHAGYASARGFMARRVCEEPLDFMFPLGHRLVDKTILRLRDLAGEPFIMCSRASSPFLYDRLMAAWQVSGFEPNVVQESDSFPTTVALVASGQGISFVGREFSRHFTQAVKVKPVIDFHFDAGHDLVWRRENNLAVMKQFLDFPVTREAPVKKPKPAAARTGVRGAMSMKIAVD